MLNTGFRIWRLALIVLVLLLSGGCQPASLEPAPARDTPPPLEFSGEGAQNLVIETWTGPALLHFTAEAGSEPFKVTAQNGLDLQPLVEADGPVDEYRGYTFPTGGKVRVEIQGDRRWEMEVLAPSEAYFPVLKVPGEQRGKGSAVILLEGEHSIAIFDTQNLADITAWAYGPSGEGGPLSFKKDGDYRGRAVLPKTAEWIIISTSEPWSVEVQLPCCEPPDYSE